jgi:hypothetical protein
MDEAPPRCCGCLLLILLRVVAPRLGVVVWCGWSESCCPGFMGSRFLRPHNLPSPLDGQTYSLRASNENPSPSGPHLLSP